MHSPGVAMQTTRTSFILEPPTANNPAYTKR